MGGTSNTLGDRGLLGRADFSTCSFVVVFLHTVFYMASASSLEASLQYHLFFFRKHETFDKKLSIALISPTPSRIFIASFQYYSGQQDHLGPNNRPFVAGFLLSSSQIMIWQLIINYECLALI